MNYKLSIRIHTALLGDTESLETYNFHYLQINFISYKKFPAT